ncbi:MAG: class I SAM-dependent methyltransferase family protein [Candidatus Aenigmarchaeota archaeon]|nr:class I SAM-dependent methyltransferase family protein [Candidatus Aenigmarchaeota archaeon]
MRFVEKLSAVTGIPKEKLPASYQVLGHIFLAKMLRLNEGEKSAVAKSIMEILPCVKTVCDISAVTGELRQPMITKIAGNGTETIVKEAGIIYRLDAAKIMFSKGNLTERKRLLSSIMPEETVIDMFAGIGYFTIGIAKKAKRVIAIEKNPDAFHYLEENIKLNKLGNVQAINADNREVLIPEKADRIIMGYFPGTEKFLKIALTMAKSGTIIHYHDICDESELWGDELRKIHHEIGDFHVISKKKVKDVAPRRVHYVVDLKII